MTGGHAGTPGRYRAGCRCDRCREAQRRRCAVEKAARLALREEVDGRLVAPVPAELHGRLSTYNNRGCRCDPCRAAGSAATARRKQAAREGLAS